MENTKGHIVLLMAPSGSGKKMLVEGLGELTSKLYFAKTYTSRPRRVDTEENPKYVFISREEFESMIDKGEFIEWADYSGNLYGTPKSEFLQPIDEGQVVFKEMELQGVQQIRDMVPVDQLTVLYIDAGSWEDLKERIVTRAEISEEELALRHQRYLVEVKFKPEADIVISNRNGELETAQATFRQVITDIIEQTQ